ncbi:MAG: hypothetical protein ISS82_00590 [Nanoarchaeota archaeon]|nr:hypothetical protein [Nanoarchaeota archaeon]
MILEYRLEEFLIENLELIEKNISFLYNQKIFRGKEDQIYVVKILKEISLL